MDNLKRMFQYISCYSLSGQGKLAMFTVVSFNTSHVTLYLATPLLAKLEKTSFNTSHVTLYLMVDQHVYVHFQFQYISCYSLSQNVTITDAFRVQFQYISCYSLSNDLTRDLIEKNLFQYISCYSLSGSVRRKWGQFISFNTSHVTLYPLMISLTNSTNTGFNTSHVTLYHGTRINLGLYTTGFNTSHVTLYLSEQCCLLSSDQCFNTSHVTLYQMKWAIDKLNLKFQYISCYSLSLTTGNLEMTYKRFNTSHVTLYHDSALVVHSTYLFQYISCYSLSTTWTSNICRSYVSIHLMLLFIKMAQAVQHRKKCFNTSHVTLYPPESYVDEWTGGVSIHLMLLFINSTISKCCS